MANSEQTIALNCSFCGKPENDLAYLIAGPTVYICKECIGLCNDILAEKREGEPFIHSNLRHAAERLRTLASHLHRLSTELLTADVQRQPVVLTHAREVAERTEAFMKALGTPSDTH